jgi:hypothetical protein
VFRSSVDLPLLAASPSERGAGGRPLPRSAYVYRQCPQVLLGLAVRRTSTPAVVILSAAVLLTYADPRASGNRALDRPQRRVGAPPACQASTHFDGYRCEGLLPSVERPEPFGWDDRRTR